LTFPQNISDHDSNTLTAPIFGIQKCARLAWEVSPILVDDPRPWSGCGGEIVDYGFQHFFESCLHMQTLRKGVPARRSGMLYVASAI
jgi:hypothetical protein